MKSTLFERLYYTERNKVNTKNGVIFILSLLLLVSILFIGTQIRKTIDLHKEITLLYNNQKIIENYYEDELSIAQDDVDTLTAILDNEISVLKESIDNLHSELLKTFYMPNIPLNMEQQQYLYLQCDIYNVDYKLMLALIELESNYNPKAINHNSNGTVDKGLFQVNSCNHSTLNKHFGRELDYLDYYDNVMAGVYYFSTIQTNNIKESLLRYNMGNNGSKNYYNKHLTYDAPYVTIVLAKLGEIKNLKEME